MSKGYILFEFFQLHFRLHSQLHFLLYFWSLSRVSKNLQIPQAMKRFRSAIDGQR